MSSRRRRWPRWATPLLLATAAVGCAGAGLALGTDRGAAPSEHVARLATPVLSVRRLPTVVAAPVAERRLRADLAGWAASAPAGSCAVVRDEDGTPLLELRGDQPLRPASTQKLLTATAAFVGLGPDTRFRTAAVGAAPVDGSVVGDLTLVGGGDPLLATADYMGRYDRQPQIFTDLAGLADAVVAAGVRRVTGSVVGDESRYDRQRSVGVWPERYVRQNVVGPLSALSVNDGFVEYPTADAYRPLVPAPDPAAHAAAVLTDLLEARGVDVAGGPRSGTAPTGTVELAGIDSPPLSEVLTQLLQESDNATAELLVKELGRGAGDPSTAGGLARISSLLQEAGHALEGTVAADGSGLALENRLTCDLLVDLLADPDVGPVLVERLPVAGQTGTLDERFLGSPLVGVLRAKTGSLTTVMSLAGEVDDGDGALRFAYLANVPDGERIDEEALIGSQQQLGEILLGWPRAVDPADLGPLPSGEVGG